MTEFRRDPIIGQWVLVHTQDSLRPDQYEKGKHFSRQGEVCQFCPGKEYLTPPEVDALWTSEMIADSPKWRVRTVPNKFPALRIEGNIDLQHFGIYDSSNGIGAHEVLIETPDHDKGLADLSTENVLDVLKGYQRRIIDLTKDKRFKYVIVFKNYGESAGATVEHAHSQIIALPMVPKYVMEELDGARLYHDRFKRCVFCDIIIQEKEEKERIVFENDHFVVFCPYVSRYTFESWIIPKRHDSQFAYVADKELHSLSSALKEALSRLKNCLSDPSYNYYLHIAPVNNEKEEAFHWHIEIVPKLANITGFEWGTGFYVVQTSPELAAQYLRETKSS